MHTMQTPSFLPPIPPDHAQALQRVKELELELQALRNLVIVAATALDSVADELATARDEIDSVIGADVHGYDGWHGGRRRYKSAQHELDATRRSLAVVR